MLCRHLSHYHPRHHLKFVHVVAECRCRVVDANVSWHAVVRKLLLIVDHLTITQRVVFCISGTLVLRGSTVDDYGKNCGNMAQHIRKAALFLFTQECIKEYFDKFNFFHGMFALIYRFIANFFFKCDESRNAFKIKKIYK